MGAANVEEEGEVRIANTSLSTPIYEGRSHTSRRIQRMISSRFRERMPFSAKDGDQLIEVFS
jgi:hypothetical protein